MVRSGVGDRGIDCRGRQQHAFDARRRRRRRRSEAESDGGYRGHELSPEKGGGADLAARSSTAISAAGRADIERSAEEPGIALAVVGGFGRPLGFRQSEQAADQHELDAAVRVGEEAEVADPAEAVRQDMQRKAPDEFADGQGHLGPLRMPVVLPAEADLCAGQRDEPTVGDGDPARSLASPASSPKKPNVPASKAARSRSRNVGGKGGRAPRTGRKNPRRQAIQRPSGDRPPPGTMQWMCGWWNRFCPQVCSTAAIWCRAEISPPQQPYEGALNCLIGE